PLPLAECREKCRVSKPQVLARKGEEKSPVSKECRGRRLLVPGSGVRLTICVQVTATRAPPVEFCLSLRLLEALANPTPAKKGCPLNTDLLGNLGDVRTNLQK